ncbi:MAG: virulence RhuM family protein [Deltaproteobacteria bacterium]|nr:virulence RhuM family protein [Deltaproteobacteria bacterium]
MADKKGEEFQKQVVVYQSSDGKLKLEAQLQQETIWLTQAQIAELFGKDRTVITKHINNIFEENELQPSETTRKSSNVQNLHITSFKPTTYYNLDMVISVGYRVNSAIATRFRQWATQTLKEYIVKGFVMDDERLEKNDRIQQAGYFDELLERIRKIRTSEKLFYEKVKLIFSETSYDYDSRSDAAKDFFATIQNKFHYAVTGKTAAELIVDRISAQKTNAGLTVFKGEQPTTDEAKTAKNYLDENELRQLYLISEQFLSFAELQIQRKRMMYMSNWVEKLDDMLRRNDFEVLADKGGVSHKAMEEKVRAEMERYRRLMEIGST